jgi:hypothetical protein
MESLAKEDRERKQEIQEHKEWIVEMKEYIGQLSEVEHDALYDQAVKSLSKKLRKNPKTIDRDSYIVFLEAATLFNKFIEERIES